MALPRSVESPEQKGVEKGHTLWSRKPLVQKVFKAKKQRVFQFSKNKYK